MKINFTLFILAIAFGLQAQPCIPNSNSIMFDGVSSYVSISPQTGLDLTTAVTLEAWIYPIAFGITSAQNSIVCKHGWSSGEAGYVLRCGGTGELSFNLGGVDTNGINVSWVEVISGTGVLALNTWSHVAATFDGYELKCYVNGNLEGTTAFRGTIASSTAYPLAISRLADPVYGPDRYFSGNIDEVRVWNRALSQTEIQSGMNNHIDPSTQTGLVSYWRMNEGSNSTIYDVAGTNNGGMVFCTWDTIVPFNAVPQTPVITYNGGILYSSAPIGNQWYMGGTQLAGETQTSYTPSQNGVYEVEVTSPEGCTAMSAQFTVTDVGIQEAVSSTDISFYPNPMQEQSMLNINATNYDGPAILIIADVQGRVLKKINIEFSSKPVQVNLDHDLLSKGVYFYELNMAGSKANGKLVVE